MLVAMSSTPLSMISLPLVPSPSIRVLDLTKSPVFTVHPYVYRQANVKRKMWIPPMHAIDERGIHPIRRPKIGEWMTKRKREDVEVMDRVYPVIDVESMVDTIEEQESSKRARWWEADRLY